MAKVTANRISSSLVRKPGRINNEGIWGYLFIAPNALGVYFFSIGPILYSFYMSLTNWDNLTNPVFVGFKNFLELLTDKNFSRELFNTFYFTVGTVPLALIISILLANALNKKIPFVPGFRTIYFLPSVTMPVAVAIVWRWLFNSELGLVNMFLGILRLPEPHWLSDPKFIMLAIIIVGIWSTIGHNIVILLAGLQNIPSSYYEAADMEGAGETVKFLKITVPLLTPAVFFLLITMLINALKAFDVIYIFSGGASNYVQGPLMDSVRTIVYGIFENAFLYMQMGYASAKAVVLFIIIMAITVLQFVFQDRWVHYE